MSSKFNTPFIQVSSKGRIQSNSSCEIGYKIRFGSLALVRPSQSCCGSVYQLSRQTLTECVTRNLYTETKQSKRNAKLRRRLHHGDISTAWRHSGSMHFAESAPLGCGHRVTFRSLVLHPRLRPTHWSIHGESPIKHDFSLTRWESVVTSLRWPTHSPHATKNRDVRSRPKPTRKKDSPHT